MRIRQRYAIPAAGVTIKYMPAADSSDSFDMNYYCLSAYVEDGADDPKSWIKLRPSVGAVREDTDKITVDDGTIYIEVFGEYNVQTEKWHYIPDYYKRSRCILEY